MGLFGFLFGKAGEAIPSQTKSGDNVIQWEGGGLKYDPELIPKLIKEHRALLALFGEIKQASQRHDFVAVQKSLHEFKLALNAHLLAENVRFYAYVKQGLVNDETSLGTMTAFWKEMQGIAKAVIHFLGKYETIGATPELHSSFGPELEGIGEALVKRIKHEEESLYTLYQPSYGH